MKLNINNKTNLPFKKIGELYDEYIEDDRLITIYDGMKEFKIFNYKKKQYQMIIEYKLTHVNIIIEELKIKKNQIMKDIEFPELPK